MDLSLHYGFERTRWMVTPYGALVTGNGNRQHTRLARISHKEESEVVFRG